MIDTTDVAADLICIIRHCTTTGDVMAAICDHATLIRQLDGDERARVTSELLIAIAKQAVGDGR